MSRNAFTFNLGPISRTLGNPPDYIGFASLPIHEVVTALLGARNKDEFIDWLWHDTFKALFTWKSGSRRSQWHHLRKADMQRLAAAIGVSANRVLKHHRKNSSLLKESQTITNEFDARYLGAEARFVQLTFKCQPAASTLVLRLVIVEAFVRAVSEMVAQAIQSLNLPFTRAVYIFEDCSDPSLSEDDVARCYRMKVQDSSLTIFHIVPSNQFATTQLTVDLTGAPPAPSDPQSIALSELLTVYRDDLTVIMALPLFIADPNRVVEGIRTRMTVLTADLLKEMGIVAQHRKQINNTDLLKFVLNEQVEVRLVDSAANDPARGKPVHALINRPHVLMGDPSLQSRCIVCGSPIQGGKGRYFNASRNILRDIFSDRFTDLEHVDLGDDVCPLCLIYASSENKKLLRGAMAILSPSTSLRAPVSHHLIEQPRFDCAERFAPNRPMVKAGMTLQELVLLTLLSRRIIAGLMPFDTRLGTGMVGDVTMRQRVKGQDVESVVGRYLPYSGAYLLFNAVETFFRTVFLGEDNSGKPSFDVWQEVQLTAYPFELRLSPSFTMLLELRLNADIQAHAQAHTLLKSRPSTVYLSQDSAFYVLVDNAVQERVDRDYVETLRLLEDLASGAGVDCSEFIRALLSGEDPLTAAYEVAKPSRGTKADPDTLRINAVNNISKRKEVMGGGTPEEIWATFIRQREAIKARCQEHPTLIHFFAKRRK